MIQGLKHSFSPPYFCYNVCDSNMYALEKPTADSSYILAQIREPCAIVKLTMSYLYLDLM